MISAAGAWAPAVLRAVIESTAAAHGVHEALVTGSKRFSYAELYANSLQRAQSLHALGIRRGDHIGILMGNNAAWVTLFFGAAMIGAVTVPVNTRFKASELAFCLKQADVKALFVADKFLIQGRKEADRVPLHRVSRHRRAAFPCARRSAPR